MAFNIQKMYVKGLEVMAFMQVNLAAIPKKTQKNCIN